MARVCCVEGCTSIDSDDVTYFPFPVAPRLRRLWCTAVQLPHSTRSRCPSPVVCSRHFAPDRTEMARGKLRLKPNTVPDIFPGRTPSPDKEVSKETSKSPEKETGRTTRSSKRKRSNQENDNTENNNKKSRRKLSKREKKSEKSDSDHEDNENSNVCDKSESKEQESDLNSDKNNQESEANALIGQKSENVVEESDLIDQESEKSDSVSQQSEKSESVSQESEKSDAKCQESGKNRKETYITSEKGEAMEFTPDVEAFYVDTAPSQLDGFDDSSEKCTIECVPEAVLGCEDAEMSETELHKEDIEDIIANYHIQSNKEIAERLKTAQENEELQISAPSSKPESSQATQTSKTAKARDENTETRRKSDNSENAKNKEKQKPTDDDEDVEFISREVMQTNYIEVPVDNDPDSVERSTSNDCMMLLEDVQVSIDPAMLFPEGDRTPDSGSPVGSPVPIEDGKPAQPISLVTSSDESDVIIQEPHIDIVEVSDEDEDDIPLVKLVNGDSSDSPSFTSTKIKETRKISQMLWGQRDFYCYQCSFTTSCSTEYHNHKLKHSSTVIHMCEVCMYTTASKAQFMKHRKKHKDEKRFKCHLCEYRAKHKMSLVYHLKSHENVSADALRLISLGLHPSDMSVASVNSVNSAKSVKGDKGYKKTKQAYRCVKCKFSSKTKQEVLVHQKICRKMHACNHCSYETNRRSDLRRHKRRRHKSDDDDEEYVPSE